MKKRVKEPQNSKSSDSHIQNIKTLQKNEKKFRTIFENANDIILYVDKYGKITDVNNKIKDILGYKRKEVLGKNFAETGTLSLTEMPKMIKLFLKSIRKKNVLGGGYTNIMEMRLRHKNGKMVDIEGSTQIIKRNGKVDGFLSILRDISIRKKAESALQESEQRYRSLIDSSHDMIQSIRPDGHFNFVNKAWYDILGYTKKELPKLTLFDIIHPDSLEHCKRAFKTILSGKSLKNIEAKFIKKNGQVIFVEGNASPRYIDGKIISTQGFFTDVTEKKRALWALEERFKELNTIFMLSKNVQNLEMPLEKLFNESVNLIPSGWQYPEITCARLIIENREYKTNNFKKSKWRQFAEIIVSNKKIGIIEVYYLEKRPKFDEGPFLKEERNLINAFARDIASTIEYRQADLMLKESEEKYRTISKNIPGMLYRADPTWKTSVISNSKEICGYSVGEFESGKVVWFNVIHPDDKKRVFKESFKITKKPLEIVQVYRIVTKGKKVKWVEDHKVSVFSKRVFQGVDGIVFDISKKKKMEEEMKKARDDLAERVEELERFSKVAIGRELRMVELKKKIKKLKGRLKKR